MVLLRPSHVISNRILAMKALAPVALVLCMSGIAVWCRNDTIVVPPGNTAPPVSSQVAPVLVTPRSFLIPVGDTVRLLAPTRSVTEWSLLEPEQAVCSEGDRCCKRRRDGCGRRLRACGSHERRQYRQRDDHGAAMVGSGSENRASAA